MRNGRGRRQAGPRGLPVWCEVPAQWWLPLTADRLPRRLSARMARNGLFDKNVRSSRSPHLTWTAAKAVVDACLRRSLKIIAVIILTLSLGLHWALLQSVAWAGMMVTFSQEGSIASAIEKTFNGKHACKLCRVVRAGCSQEKAPATDAKPLKLEACAPVQLMSKARELNVTLLPESPASRWWSRTSAPLLQPPRCA